MKIRFAIKIISSNRQISVYLRKIILKCHSIKFLAGFFNDYYNTLNYNEKEIIHYLFSKEFRDNNRNKISIDRWRISFHESEIFMPLRKSKMWLDWDSALSITGHDIEIKSTYEYLLQKLNLNYVFDVGANYGTHSLLFLANNIKTYSFEPNKNCFEYFNECLKLNKLDGNFINNAVGSEVGEAELTFPENNTWLGTISANENDFVNEFEGLNRVTVKVDTLDNFSKLNNLGPDLIKIDTEGFEIKVLIGAEKIIKQNKPVIIFESNNSQRNRPEIFDFLNKLNYCICDLIDTKQDFLFLDLKSFKQSSKNNFIAFPNDHFIINKK